MLEILIAIYLEHVRVPEQVIGIDDAGIQTLFLREGKLSQVTFLIPSNVINVNVHLLRFTTKKEI